MSFNLSKLEKAFMLLDKGIEEGVFPGVAAAVGDNKGFVRVEVKGNKRLYPYDEKLNRESLFDLASLTKVVATTMLLMKMLESGLISVYDRVSEYIPNFKGDG
ncbi:MAG TPA: serine hydrolase, partial [Caldanaerobacter subterraneus]